MPAINQIGTTSGEIVLSERVVTTEWRVRQITESIEDRFVRVEIELGPFITEQYGPDGQTRTRGSSMRGMVVWQNDEYDAIRDTWSNVELLAAIQSRLNA